MRHTTRYTGYTEDQLFTGPGEVALIAYSGAAVSCALVTALDGEKPTLLTFSCLLRCFRPNHWYGLPLWSAESTRALAEAR